MRQKTRILIYILIAAAAVIIGTLAILENHRADVPVSAQEHIDLGRIYLTELSYEKASLEFTEAIEIEPLNPDAYLGLAEAYVGMGNTEKAVEVLEEGYDKTGDERLKSMLERLLTQDLEKTSVTLIAENGEIISPDSLIAAEETIELYIPSNINIISDIDIIDGIDTYIIKDYGKYVMNANLYQGYVNVFLSEKSINGLINKGPFTPPIQINNFKNIYRISCAEVCPEYGVFYKIAEPAISVYDINGNVIQKGENIYDRSGKLAKADSYKNNGELLMSKEFEYGENGSLIKEINDSGYKLYSYNFDNKIVNKTEYNKDGVETYGYTCTYYSNGNIKTYRLSDSTGTYVYDEYDLNGNMIHYVSEGHEFSGEFDTKGKLLKDELIYNGLSDTTTYSYDSLGRCIESQSHGISKIYGGEYGEDGISHNYDSVTKYNYDDNGNLITVTTTYTDEPSNINNYTTQYEYDSHNRLIKEDNNGFYTKYFYNNHGFVERIDCNTYSLEYTYVKIKLPKTFADQIKEEYGIDLTE